MGRKCEGCNICDTVHIGMCGLCKYSNNEKSYDICELCDSTGNCNFEIDLKKFGVFFDLLGIQQAKTNLKIAINSESDYSLKILLIETLKILEGKENEY